MSIIHEYIEIKRRDSERGPGKSTGYIFDVGEREDVEEIIINLNKNKQGNEEYFLIDRQIEVMTTDEYHEKNMKKTEREKLLAYLRESLGEEKFALLTENIDV